MAASTASGLQMAAVKPCVSSPRPIFGAGAAFCNADMRRASWAKLTSACHISSVQPFQHRFSSSASKSGKGVIKAMAESSDKPLGGLPINLKGRISVHYALHDIITVCVLLMLLSLSKGIMSS